MVEAITLQILLFDRAPSLLKPTQTSSRNYAFGGSHGANRRGHVPQLSISDDNHHVTEAIGDMYGDHQYGKRDSRPLSFVPSTPPNPPNSGQQPRQTSRGGRPSPPQSLRNARNSLVRNISSERVPTQVNGQGSMVPARSKSGDGEGVTLSPSGSIHRSNSETANSQFPLNDIDYESNPNAVAQELNNLAALRRMSMDVNASGDPDLPSFTSNFGIPSAPPHGTDADDTARLYWVPASVHPELAPMEFKTFLDKKVKSLKRRSEEKSLSPDGLSPGGSAGSLRRRKSMLSRQIDNSGGRGAEGYTDGAERLDRKRSQSGDEALKSRISNLHDLEVLVNEPERIMQRLSLETGEEGEVLPGDDVPILPNVSGPNNSLKRSTRTTYRRGGSLRKGERGPFSKRAAARSEMTDGEDSPVSSPITPAGEAFSLLRVQTEPIQAPERIAENFSRPGRLNRRAAMAPQARQSHPSSSSEEPATRQSAELRDQPNAGPQPRHFVSQIASNGRLGVTPESLGKGIPHIVETPPPPEDVRSTSRQGFTAPERTSSHEPPPIHKPSGPPSSGPPNSRAQNWTPQSRTNQTVKANQTLNDMTSHPSPLPGNNTRTDSLSFIPTLTEDKKSAEARKAKEAKEKEKEADGSRKSSWSWGSLLGNEEKEKEKRKAEEAKKAKSRLGKPAEKSHDNTRLDLLQTTMEGSWGRESLVLDRGDLKLEEERKKESSRKSAGSDTKKEKESGFISSLFGGGKKKGERESLGKKHFSRNLSPEPPARVLKPDIDYNWTRFSILEERAIYRMAHIKLANPRRALHSQVLLSNFM